MNDDKRVAARADATGSNRRTCEIIEGMSALEAFTPEWLTFLDERAGTHSAYAHPAFARSELLYRSDYRPAIVVVRRYGQVEAIAPGFFDEARIGLDLSVRRIVSFRARIWRMFGSAVVFAVDADRAACMHALLTTLTATRIGFVRLDCLEVDSDTWMALQGPGIRGTGYRLMLGSDTPDVTRRIRFPASYDEYFASLSHHTRSMMRRRQKKLAASGTLRLVRCTTPEEVGEFVIGLDAVYNRSWQARSFGPMARSGPGEVAYYTHLAAAGIFRGYVLWDADRPLAFAVGFQRRRTYYYAETGYDMSASSLAPGMVLQMLLCQDLLEHDPVVVLDFGLGDSQMKQMFANDVAGAYMAYFVRRLPWRALVRSQKLIGAAEHAVRAGLKRIGADAFARRLLRRGTTAAKVDSDES